MRAIILAGGRGSRLNEFTENLPKGMLPLAGKSILERQIETLRASGITDISIVRGYQGDMINFPGITYYDNFDWMNTNMVASLFSAREKLKRNDDVLVLYADLLYEQKVIEAIKKSNVTIGVVADTDWKPYWERRLGSFLEDSESFVIGDDNKLVSLGISNPPSEDMHARYVGMIFLSKHILPTVCTFYDTHARKSWNDKWYTSPSFRFCYMTDFIQGLIDEYQNVSVIPIQRGWMEFDTNDDYKNAMKWLESGELNSIINIDL
jgi:choline kinase